MRPVVSKSNVEPHLSQAVVTAGPQEAPQAVHCMGDFAVNYRFVPLITQA